MVFLVLMVVYGLYLLKQCFVCLNCILDMLGFIGNPSIYVLLIDTNDENPYDYWNSLEKNQGRIWML